METYLEVIAGRAVAALLLGFFCWCLVRSIADGEIIERPGDALVLVPMLGGMILFLYWIVAGNSRIGIDEIRLHGVPLGLWGLGTAILMLIIQSFDRRE